MQNEKCKGECLKGLLPMPQVLHLMVVYHGKISLSTHITKNISISGELSKKESPFPQKMRVQNGDVCATNISQKSYFVNTFGKKRTENFESSVLEIMFFISLQLLLLPERAFQRSTSRRKQRSIRRRECMCCLRSQSCTSRILCFQR